jgi:hypothetical protein
MTRRRLLIGAILLVAVVLGAIREFLFLNLNYAIDHLANHREVSYAHSMFRAAVVGLTLQDLIALKWIFSVGFIAAMLGLSVVLARSVFGDHRYRTVLVTGFLLVGGLALLLHLARAVHPAFEVVSVKVLHMLQYPIILFFLWASALLKDRSV